MKKILATLLMVVICISAYASGDVKKKKLITGYDGGMMLHTGYVAGRVPPIDFKGNGVPLGIGGAIRLHMGKHFRIGSEGYVSTVGSLQEVESGSYLKYGWGGILGDFRWTFKKFMPYAGVTIGGGSQTTHLIFEGDKHDWIPEPVSTFNKKGFFMVDPFIGCDYIAGEVLHLTLKVDCMCPISGGQMALPVGPRVYFGFIFFH